ncbi:MAG: glucan biosynthesis protein D [Zymomonas mobilis subsp. pomaceae]|uniref:Periplasmic glucan biosynthesis protein MdoG n=1 Tax=Zymomonas mobilis subsp. pomaceae (strain ATCC 29192 / DSM 22645 / JCM 10191 / CCUG 17912 / NBRC 13757 / NCIMB 11200 / NRRL B-4491 / Barker I) TaxID=579138 RepID=F8EUX7_ZYMMT|nr:glucan biosynthesis protein D [Zymomonas mobilis]AEI37265.1 periplasmic glucan biosynthesis protein MdoG [Zymomonas mobilis subsp. pomaceae ATCC 29192]MDX5948634.1 glucan biosynthesis protein D [Zymomonas mobilis subsp. pomaceae]GEB88440.1 glucan biosynthesis protein D [Zymomonas mobilis subsp. pomaceae]
MSATYNRRQMLFTLGIAAVAGTGFKGDSLFAAALNDGLSFGKAQNFSWEGLKSYAIDLSQHPYTPPKPTPQVMAIDYNAMSKISWRDDRTLWANDPLRATQFFPVNRAAPIPLKIYVVEKGQSREMLFSDSLFNAPADSPLHKLPQNQAGFGGFRFMNPNRAHDWLAFMGASYFRSSGDQDQYGLSARGLAIDTGFNHPEEFPVFTRFWLERSPNNGDLTVYALLEGPSVSGAYRIVNRHQGGHVVQDIDCTVRLRKNVERLGFGVMTSMFWYGENNHRTGKDWRPEVHDSDGLALWTGKGERLWRPLENHTVTRVSSFSDENPKGWGLIQRDRDFDHYQDDNFFYEKRPNLWLETRNNWGAGAINLLEMATTGETDDNIGAMWVPAGPAKAGDRHDLSYRLTWLNSEPLPKPSSYVIATRTGMASDDFVGQDERWAKAGIEKIVVDFEGSALEKLPNNSVDFVVTASQGQIIYSSAAAVAGFSNRWRATVEIKPVPNAVTELRGYLKQGNNAVSETWLYAIG